MSLKTLMGVQSATIYRYPSHSTLILRSLTKGVQLISEHPYAKTEPVKTRFSWESSCLFISRDICLTTTQLWESNHVFYYSKMCDYNLFKKSVISQCVEGCFMKELCWFITLHHKCFLKCPSVTTLYLQGVLRRHLLSHSFINRSRTKCQYGWR